MTGENLKDMLDGAPPTVAEFRAGMASIIESLTTQALADDNRGRVLASAYAVAALQDGMHKVTLMPASTFNSFFAELWKLVQENRRRDGK